MILLDIDPVVSPYSTIFQEEPLSLIQSVSQVCPWCLTKYKSPPSCWKCEGCTVSEYTEDDMRAVYTEAMDHEADTAAQSHMNAAGRWISHPFGDMRSAARARQRHRKIHENKGGCNSYKCRKEGQAYQRQINRREKRENVRFGVEESRKYVSCYTLDSFRETKHKFVEWDIRLPEEYDEYVANIHDDVLRYTILHHNADTFERPEPYVQVGETFTTWCQRRVAEMREVQESRIRRRAPTPLKPAIWKTIKTDSRLAKNYSVYTGDSSTTTLPTNPYDALGHTLLRSILTPSKQWLKHCRRSGIPPFAVIDGYAWFGEYEWMWHKNMSGCWEIGYSGNCMDRDADWQEAPIPCPHCCAGNGSMYYECYCREFIDAELMWTTSAPEEGQSCSLFEWVGKEGRKVMLEEAVEELGTHGPDMDVKTCEAGMDGEWEFVSSASSETWSVIGAE